ncbi:MAG TPA: hypothetical protein DEA87_02250 [Candidatus Veblenbacteria bacterium]|uniref:Uncharacterized protein n=2 Tax=Candidatus Vebleniibacteriota TaxID=1817921 RepID=A0A1G2Q681_9BACT|nr:MAG: hypothetical protein A2588_01905 [Candidatus Veblenbacteria bacterium RIFOXYD1_FULL_43_11]OHA56548.1 MAG: hypothetical protein A2441_02135 [Candidatus Veblenbacteria bacterium RIFOXYC2_FULL_42_11]HBT92272.1 hypothetical protein [Candidatus Veblenbacteria bacterium]HCX39122.1 hypothetical protein [Candidatus Veblenbacteria bacterium]
MVLYLLYIVKYTIADYELTPHALFQIKLLAGALTIAFFKKHVRTALWFQNKSKITAVVFN